MGTEQLPPMGEASLLAWLQTGAYLSWASESAMHVSEAGHDGMVLAHVNDLLYSSLQAGTTPHPMGSAAVKDLYDDMGVQIGWVVTIKIEDGNGQLTWYWFEHYDDVTWLDEVGAGVCAGCHSGGEDYVRSPFPLQ